MSELAHHDTEIPTQKATEINVNNVVPLPRRSEELREYSEMSETETAELFLSLLRHESRSHLHGDNLATLIEEHLGQKSEFDSTLDIDSLPGRLSQIVRLSNPSNEMYDKRLDNDPVFRSITDKLVSKDSKQNSSLQRSAARKLLDLRASLPDFESADDETWHDVTDRLFS